MTETVIAPPKTKSQALRSTHAADFPALTGREEEWRFTPLKRLRGLATITGPATDAAPKPEYGTPPAGVTVAAVPGPARGADARVGAALTPFDRISAWAYEQSEQALLVEIAPETVLPEAFVLRLTGASAEGAAAGHTHLSVGRFAEAVLVLEQTGSTTLADNVEVVVGDGAKLTLVTVADWAADTVQAQHVRFQLGRDAKVTHVQVSLGGDLVRQFTSVEYTGRGGDAELFGLYFAEGRGTVGGDGAGGDGGAGQHLEHRMLVNHSVPDCRSYVGYRGALLGDGAHTVWVGDVLIQDAATGTDTYEVNRNLLLSDGARADSVPNLEIETGEVAGAGHASATGRFDDEHLFYLMARGIPEQEARKLVVRGFFAELLDKIPVEELRERLGAAIEARLVVAEGQAQAGEGA